MNHPSHADWIWLNFKIGAFSIGVASRLLLFEEAMVRRYGWVTLEEFQEMLTLAQMLPGPNLVNFSACAGSRLVPMWVSLVGLCCLIAPGALIAIAVYSVAPLDNYHVKKLFQGMAIGAFMLTARFIWQLIRGMRPPELKVSAVQRALRLKWLGRGVIAVAVTIAGLMNLPAAPMIGIAALLCLAWEFVW